MTKIVARARGAPMIAAGTAVAILLWQVNIVGMAVAANERKSWLS
jgi:hypothetical protein